MFRIEKQAKMCFSNLFSMLKKMHWTFAVHLWYYDFLYYTILICLSYTLPLLAIFVSCFYPDSEQTL